MPEGQLWGDCHTHSNYSDGLMGIAEQTPHFESFGQDFRFQTDHHMIAVPEGKPGSKWLHAADWARYGAECRKASNARHLCIPGVELGWQVDAGRQEREGWFHTKLYPPPGEPVPDESFYAGKPYVETIAAAKEAGHRMVIAHMDQGAPLERFSGAEIHGLEVRQDIEEQRPLFSRPTLKEWDRMLRAGHKISLSSGSDAHQPDLWAGSALRTVVLDTPFEAAAILDAVVAGRSYLSGTWHPDGYAALGWPGRPNPVDGGASVTHMIAWWMFKEFEQLKDRDPRQVVEEVYQAALKDGRCRREDYPVLRVFNVNGTQSGGTARAGGKTPLRVAWRAHLPLRTLRLIADARTCFELPPAHPSYGRLEGELDIELDLRGKRYVRLEIEAWETAGGQKRESLLGNPVYLEA